MQRREIKLIKIISPPVLYTFMQMFMEVVVITLTYIGEMIGIYKKNMLMNNNALSVADRLNAVVVRNASYITFFAAIAGAALFGCMFRDAVRKKEFPVQRNVEKGKYLLPVFFAITVSLAISNLITFANIDNIYGSYQVTSDRLLQGNIIYRIFAIGVIVPITEELIYRGLMYNRIKKETGVISAIFLSAFAFGLFHFNLVQGIYAFIIGLICALCYEIYGNITVSIAMHMAINIVAVLLDYFGIDKMLNSSVIFKTIMFIIESIIAVYIFDMIIKKQLDNSVK